MNSFGVFSKHFCSLCLSREYRLVTDPGLLISETPHWVLQKVESASLVYVHVIDASRCPMELVWEKDARLREYGENLLEQVKSVHIIYIIAGLNENSLLMDIEPYFGQPVYSVYWLLDLNTGAFFVPSGQPKDLFGLKSRAAEALSISKEDTDFLPLTFHEINLRVSAALPKVKHIISILPWGIIGINLIVLMLMYLDGYPGDPLTAVRFGAIFPPLIRQNNEYHRLFTAVFIHFGFTHFMMNAVGLIIFGTRVERYFGRVAFISIYLMSGLAGSVFSLLFTRGYAAGASGAVYGLAGAVFAFTRVTRQSMDQISGYIMFIYIIFGLAMGFATDNVDNFAHIGGLFAGFLSAVFILKIISKRKENPL